MKIANSLLKSDIYCNLEFILSVQINIYLFNHYYVITQIKKLSITCFMRQQIYFNWDAPMNILKVSTQSIINILD